MVAPGIGCAQAGTAHAARQKDKSTFLIEASLETGL
jgi:hypothetical protein